MINEAIILAGGKGTRLQSIVNDVPKPLADVAGRPFLEYILDQLLSFGINRIVISVGYKADKIISHFGVTYKDAKIIYAIEDKPLGTGGGLRFALNYCLSENILVLNGDTYFGISFSKLDFYKNHYSASFVIALREINNNGRFGGVEIDNKNTIINFLPKQKIGKCTINAGVYLLNKSYYLSHTENKAFSIEDDFFSLLLQKNDFKGIECNGYFIDIGIPEDYHNANKEYYKFNQLPEILILDRDGVINKRIVGDYVRIPEQFIFENNAAEAIAKFNLIFQKIFVVTNQRGVGRGLMSKSDLDEVHSYLIETLKSINGRIDGIYSCVHSHEDECQCRKPQTGLFKEILIDNPTIQGNHCIMVGDSISDLEFGRNIEAKNIYISHEGIIPHPSLWDEIYNSLYDFQESFFMKNDINKKIENQLPKN